MIKRQLNLFISSFMPQNYLQIQPGNQQLPKLSHKSKSNNKPIHNVRAKLQSMRTIKYDYQDGDLGKLHKALKGEDKLKKLQKSLQKYSRGTEDPEMDSEGIPQDKDQTVSVEERLWHYFKKKTAQFSEKVEKEKVNGWKRILETIVRETNKKILSNKNCLMQMDSFIQNKYKQTHEIYKQIQTIKLEECLEKKLAKRKKTEPGIRKQKIKVLQENVQELKGEIALQQQEKYVFEQEIKKMEAQKKSLFLNLLKNQYYFEDGVFSILKELASMNHTLKESNFPAILDSRSKFFLMQIFNQILQRQSQSSKTLNLSRNKTMSNKSEHIKSSLGFLTQKHKLKQIYGSTHEYLSTLIREGAIKKEEFKLPEINTSRQYSKQKAIQNDLYQNQKKRIQCAYSQQVRSKVKKILFGIKMETILNS